MLKVYAYPAIFRKEGNRAIIEIPDIGTAITQEKSISELYRKAAEVLDILLYSLVKDKKDIPEPSEIDAIKAKEDERLFIITASIDTDIKYIKKTVTIPEHLNEEAIKHNINFSKVLRESLEEELLNFSRDI